MIKVVEGFSRNGEQAQFHVVRDGQVYSRWLTAEAAALAAASLSAYFRRRAR